MQAGFEPALSRSTGGGLATRRLHRGGGGGIETSSGKLSHATLLPVKPFAPIIAYRFAVYIPYKHRHVPSGKVHIYIHVYKSC